MKQFSVIRCGAWHFNSTRALGPTFAADVGQNHFPQVRQPQNSPHTALCEFFPFPAFRKR